MGGPVIGVELLGRGEEVVHEEVELVAEVVPAGVLSSRAADPAERLGLLDIVAVIEADQAVIMVLGLVQAARDTGQFGHQVDGQGMFGGQLQRLFGTAAGFGQIATLEGQAGQLGLDLGLLFGQRLEGLDRRRSLALRLQARGPAQCGLGIGGRLRLIDLGRFFITPMHEQHTRLGEIGRRAASGVRSKRSSRHRAPCLHGRCAVRPGRKPAPGYLLLARSMIVSHFRRGENLTRSTRGTIVRPSAAGEADMAAMICCVCS